MEALKQRQGKLNQIESFERELKTKLAQKASGSQSEETVIKKAFKYFDLNNNGTVEPDEFAKAIEKCGIAIPTRQDLNALFAIYDTDRSGALDYNEFSAMLFAKPPASYSPQKGKAGGKGTSDLAAKLKDKLASRGARGIIGLGKQFRIMDDNNSRSLDIQEFTKAMKDYMLGFSDQEIKSLFSHFDIDGNGTIDYDEFIRGIRGPMNNNRRKIVMQAFKKLDRDGNGYVDIMDIKGVYNAQKHPDVLQGKKTEDQILMEFLETFEVQHSMRNNGAPDHIVTEEEFVEYYNNISASIDNDEYFTLMMNNAWKINEGDRTYGKGWSNKQADSPGKSLGQSFNDARQEMRGQAQAQMQQRSAQGQRAGGATASEAPPMNMSDKQLCERMREKLAARGGRGIFGLQRQFKIADDDESKNLCMPEFKKAVKDFRVGISEADAERLFRIFDRDQSGAIDYDEFLRGVRGEMNDFRKMFCKKAFNIMDKDKSGKLDIDDIKGVYNAKMHPDVKSGKKTEDDILGEFLDTFEMHYSLSHPDSKDRSISLDEWIEYYNNVSMSIDNDQYFELMMNNTWNLDGKRVTKKGWGGEV